MAKKRFPMTRHQVAKALDRPYSTIITWTSSSLITPGEFEELEKKSEAAPRKSTTIRTPYKCRPKPEHKRYYHPASNEIITEKDIKNGAAGIKNGDTLYEIKRAFTYKITTTWGLEEQDENEKKK